MARCFVVIIAFVLLVGSAIADKLDEMIAAMDETVVALTATKVRFEESFATPQQKIELQKIHREMLQRVLAARETCLRKPENRHTCSKAMYSAIEASKRELEYMTRTP